jgi:hypothetical protein
MPFDKKHIKNTEAFAKQLKDAFLRTADKISAMSEDPSIKFSSSFSFEENPQFILSVKAIFSDLQGIIEKIITAGIVNEWTLSNNKNDALVYSYVKNLTIIKKKPDWTNRNVDALEAFTRREVNGLNLSNRIWNIVDQYQSELEIHLGYGLLNGDSAATISRRVREYLQDPSNLFRRVRNEVGELEWSKAAKAYEPGQGKYRSSYKNALRLTVTETNMAYRMADQLRWDKLGFVLGYTVSLSGSHPLFDICDELEGEYPKDFIFVGWHPQCLCKATPVLMSAEEYNKYEDAILNGTEEEFLSKVQMIQKVPDGFMEWIEKNAERSQGWKNQPYFIQDNFHGGVIEGGLKVAS